LPAEPVYHHRLLTNAETLRLADALAPLAEIHGPALIQVVSFPTWGDLAQTLRQRHGWPIMYDSHDLLAGFGNIAQEIVAAETVLLQGADHVLFSSEYLRQLHTRTISLPPGRVSLLRNAVDSRFVERAGAARNPASGRKVAGYIGALEKWFDVGAVRAATEANPETLFRIVGRVQHERVMQLSELPNIELAGEAAHEELPEVLAGFSVGLIPFVINELTRAADPIKLYEYFSAGLPVVSSRLPEVERYGDMVYFANTPSDFAAQVSHALSENDAALARKRIDAARNETWDQRADRLLDIAKAVLAGTV
jgi:glycosyltransferase involved in cell wall biosynthesis